MNSGILSAVAVLLSVGCGVIGEPAGVDIDEQGHRRRSRCGDGVCSSRESCESCPDDCGICELAEEPDAGLPTPPTESRPAEPAMFARPYGPNAPWNVPAAGLPIHSESTFYRDLLWNDAPDRAGNFNLSFDGYTYPVYEAGDATVEYPVSLSGYGNLNGKTMPWNPEWLPATGTDGQVIVLDPATGREWNLWQVSVSGGVVHATNGNLVPGSYWSKEDGFSPSRGCGIQYLAMLVRPEEIEQGVIEHALSMPISNPSGDFYVAPATKIEHPDRGAGIPEGMRFALDVTDAEIDAWLASLPSSLPASTRRSARIIAVALRDYGWFISDTSGGAHLQFEDRASAQARWVELGLDVVVSGKEYPRDLLDGLMTRDRIYTIVPSDQY